MHTQTKPGILSMLEWFPSRKAEDQPSCYGIQDNQMKTFLDELCSAWQAAHSNGVLRKASTVKIVFLLVYPIPTVISVAIRAFKARCFPVSGKVELSCTNSLIESAHRDSRDNSLQRRDVLKRERAIVISVTNYALFRWGRKSETSR